jgi:hypothetical protein
MRKRMTVLGPRQLLTPAGLLRCYRLLYFACHSTAAVRKHTARPGQEPKPDVGEACEYIGSVQVTHIHAWLPSNPIATATPLVTQGA